MVDEYQDTNRIQARLFELLSDGDNVITVVGDDAQAIYGFRAATVDNILSFERDFSASRIVLGSNYRSTPEIVQLANASIRKNPNQIFKDISAKNGPGGKPAFFIGRNPQDEAEFVLRQIQTLLLRGSELSELGVLFRATRQVASLELALKKAEIPYEVVGGDDFFGLEHVKLVIDMARLLVNPEDSIALGAIQEVTGISSAIAVDRLEQRAEEVQLSFWDVATDEAKKPAVSSKADYQALIKFREVLDTFKDNVAEGQPITPVISQIIEYLTPYIKRRKILAWEGIEEDFAVLQTVASQFISLGDFINTVALQQFVDDQRNETDKVVLSTIHSAKGLEWDTVFVIGLVEFWFPLNWAIQQSGTDEEERRLFYVAVTRARKNLFISSYGESVNPYGRTMQQQLSRFVSELPREVYEFAR
jgi:DNA helicase-2/ATP-dependent DNA helicase PcrA